MEIKHIYLNYSSPPSNNDISTAGNVDAIVTLDDDSRYVASIFTFENIELIREESAFKKEYLFGKYFWVKNMLLADSIEYEDVKTLVEHLIKEGDFLSVFQRLNEISNND